MTDTVLDPYLLQKLRKALSEDVRVGENNIRVTHAGGRIWLSGTIGSATRKQAATELAREIVPGIEIHNDLETLVLSDPTEESIE